jgi:NAD(P)-dependent dehydrogenase (short-subunit alcohol dehydrogenase family)
MAGERARLQGKIAIVTGAGKGIGAACAQRFAEEGATVLVADISEELGARVVMAIEAAGGTASFQRTDVTQEKDIVAMIDAAVDRYGRLDILFNNAGGSAKGTDPGETELERLTADQWDYTMALNLRSVFLGLKYSVPVMRRGGGGVVLCTSSDAGLKGSVGLYHYNAAKAGLNRLIQSFAQSVGRDNIRLNGIAPGFTLTDALRGNLPPGTDESILKVAQPLPRAGLPVDIANAGVFLASDEGSFITGVVLPVDGGWYAQAPQGERFTMAVMAAMQKDPDAAKDSGSSFLQG